MKYPEIKKEKQERYDALAKECKLFYAFNDKQFDEGLEKVALEEGDKLVRMPHGGFMPKSLVQKYIDGMKDLDKWYKKAIKDSKAEEAEILFELRNHECFYSQSIEDVLYLPYPPEKIYAVFQKHLKAELAAQY